MGGRLWLRRADDRGDAVDAFVERAGRRVGLGGVLEDLNREARRVRVPARAATWGFSWDRQDQRSRVWWPQGITCSADAGDPAGLDGRSVLITSAYARDLGHGSQGARVSVLDISDPARIRYRHVLLVDPLVGDGGLSVRPVPLHAGGLAWYGDTLHVAGTTRGLCAFHLDDVVAVPQPRDPHHLRLTEQGLEAFGYRYVLPLRSTCASEADEGVRPLRHSFVSVDRSSTPHALVAGEYGLAAADTRLARFELGAGGLVGAAQAATGVQRMQGATVVDGTWLVTTSRGRYRLGSVWTGRPGRLVEHRHALPVGPEDLTTWRSRDELWSLSEYPGARYLLAMPASRFVD